MRVFARRILESALVIGLIWGCGGPTEAVDDPGTACETDADCAGPTACQTGTCNMDKAECDYTINDGHCLVAGACHVNGSVSETDQCLKCDTTQDNTALVPITCDEGQTCDSELGCIAQSDLCGGDDAKCVTQDQCLEGKCGDDGVCSFSPQEGITCDDADACTTGDACDAAGGCSGQFDGTLCDCETDDQCSFKDCHDKACVDTACMYTEQADDTDCDDTDFCTVNDVCAAGECAGTPKECAAPPDCQVSGCETICDPDGSNCVGECTTTPSDAGEACDDGENCTKDDVCDGSGGCAGAWDTSICECQKAEDCTDSIDQCQEWTCVAGQCTAAAKTNDIACDDGNACTENDTCQSGSCAAGTSVSCNDTGTPCTYNECNTAVGCKEKNADEQTLCDDGMYCTVSDHCNGMGSCIGGGGLICDDPDDNPCNIVECHESDDSCSPVDAPDGQSCETGDVCVEDAECQNGSCIQTAPVQCAADTNECTVAVCKSDGNKGCKQIPIAEDTSCGTGASCKDGNKYSAPDYCNATGTCKSPSAKNCANAFKCYNSTSCRTSCTMDSQCIQPYDCESNKCSCFNQSYVNYWIVANSSPSFLYGPNCGHQKGQTFMVYKDSQLIYLKAYLKRATSCSCGGNSLDCVNTLTGKVTLSLYETSSSHKPTGSVIASVQKDLTNISTTPGWLSFSFKSQNIYLEGDKEYAMVLSSTSSKYKVYWEHWAKTNGTGGPVLTGYALGKAPSSVVFPGKAPGKIPDGSLAGGWTTSTSYDYGYEMGYTVTCPLIIIDWPIFPPN